MASDEAPARPAPAKAPARQADRVAAVVLLLFSGFVILASRSLPYWVANAPGPGFLPFWLGALLACAAAGLLLRTTGAGHGRGETVEVSGGVPSRAATVRVVAVVGLTAAAAAGTLLLGMVLASGAFMGATLTYLRPGRSRANMTAALLTGFLVWLLFARWLAVPLPVGPFGF